MAVKVAVFDTKHYDKESFNEANKNFGLELHFYKDRLSLGTMELAKGKDAVCIFVNEECDKEVISHLATEGVKLIALRCAGFNNVDMAAARGHLRVVRVPAYSPYAVAEYALTLMLELNRKVYRAVNRTREGNFKLDGLEGFDMHGKTIGLVGMGHIAKVLAQILEGFGVKMLCHVRHPQADADSFKAHGITPVSMDELYAQSDIISLHCPLTDETKFLINKESIAKMKKGVMLINTGRGKLVNTEDLIEGLKSRQIGAAGLDVYEEEENYFYEDLSDKLIDDDKLALLLMMPNVVVTSHQAFFTREALRNIATTTLQNISDWAAGKDLVNEVK